MGKRVAPIVGALLVLTLAQLATAGQIGYWAFDEGSGTTARDGSGKGNNGTLTGGPVWTVGKFGKALQFDGVDDYVNIPHNDALIPQTGKTSVSLWINAKRHTGPGGSQWQGILGKGGSPRLYNLYTEASQVIHFSTTNRANSGYEGTLSTGLVPLNEWVHITVVVDTNYQYYINGQPAGTTSEGLVGIQTGGTSPLTIGQTGESNFFQGMIDEVRLYDMPLTAAQVLDLFTSNTGPTWPKAAKPVPADGTIGITMAALSWTKGDGATKHNVYIGTTPELTDADLVKANLIGKTSYNYMGELVPGATYYWRVDELDSKANVTTGDVWKFTVEPITAFDPKPADAGTGAFPVLTLKWAMPSTSMGEHLYFSSVQSEVANAAAAADKGPMEASEFNPGVLRSSSTYYWRVDETTLDPDTFEEVVVAGPVWSFTTADAVPNKVVRQWWTGISSGGTVANLTGDARYPGDPTGTELLDRFKGPTGFADTYGTRMYGWLIPPQTGDYTFWVSSDDSSQLSLSTDVDPANATAVATVSGWTGEEEWTKFPTQKSATIALTAGQKYYIEALQADGTGGDNLAVGWGGPGIGAGPVIIASQYVDAFALPPLQAFGAKPADKTVDVAYTGTLTWMAGEKAQKHDVYLGTDANAVAAADTSSPLYQGQQAEATFAVTNLQWNTTYYWRVDEVNPAEAGSPWKGNVWSFTTCDFIPVDDFESYTGAVGNEVYSTWLDNYDAAAAVQKGAIVGTNNDPFVETRTAYVHGGKQSMPLNFDNSGPKYFCSETVRAIDAGVQNWTFNGAQTLSLWFKGGTPAKFIEMGNDGYILSGSGNDIWNNADCFRFAYKALTGDGSITARVDALTRSNEWSKAGVMIREKLDTGSANAALVMSSDHGISFQWRETADGGCGSTATAGLTTPYWIRLTRTGNVFKAECSADGVTWARVGTDHTVTMGAAVYIGMAVTSHDAALTSVGQFANVTTTVAGAWTLAEIGVDPEPTADPTGLYVTLKDASNKSFTIAYPVSYATALCGWNQWTIPLSSFTGVNAGKVKEMRISVGDPKSTTPGPSGTVWIDDVRVIK